MDNQTLPAVKREKYGKVPVNKTNRFYLAKVNTGEPPEAKSVWGDRLLFLLQMPLDTKQLKDKEFMMEIIETYGELKGITISDVMHLAIAVRAMHGDVKAYNAVSKVIAAANPIVKEQQSEDPMAIMAKMLYGALQQAGSPITEKDGPIIIDVEVDK